MSRGGEELETKLDRGSRGRKYGDAFGWGPSEDRSKKPRDSEVNFSSENIPMEIGEYNVRG